MDFISNQTPSQNPADSGTLAGMLGAVMRKFQQGMDGMLPATVVSYDRAANVATVQPSILLLTTQGQTMSRAAIARVPVLALGGGGFVINFPLKPGDTGWIEASDRDISLYMQAQAAAQPNTLRLHSFEDGRFIPDVMRKYAMPSSADADADMIISTTDGKQSVIVSPDGLQVVGDAVLIKASGAVTIEAAELAINAPTVIAGGLEVDGIEFGTHKHMVTGTGTPTNGPQN